MPRTLTATLLALLVTWLTGCSATIVPPEQPDQPVTVYVLDHGRHSSLVLPTESGGIRYSYGDWDYYVLRKTSLWNGLYALLRPSPSALGREELARHPDPDNLADQLRVGITRILPITVEQQSVAALHHDLEATFLSALATRHYSEAFGLDFVHYPRPYTLRHNSNRKVAEWLEQLGCDVTGSPILSNWHLADRSP